MPLPSPAQTFPPNPSSFPLDGHSVAFLHGHLFTRPLIPSTNKPPLFPRSSFSEQSTVIPSSVAVAPPAPAHLTTYSHGHRHTVSVSRFNQLPSSGILALAAAALDRTQNAIAAIPESTAIRLRQPNGALSGPSLLASSSPSSEPSSPDKYHRLRSTSSQSLLSSPNLDAKLVSQAVPANHPPSQLYTI
ncbi:hypothetical protein B0T10DRAFT_588680 [Thelonectria olida]|uniref:Uncharacterized protein n=1 Tax=Thelonectria olida TaxID=1576542 RepID=A0A9P8VUD1_9HYPO|nr:hypothetical protein B0T10DRAFT_588680 [Thelonectria olida]